MNFKSCYNIRQINQLRYYYFKTTRALLLHSVLKMEETIPPDSEVSIFELHYINCLAFLKIFITLIRTSKTNNISQFNVIGFINLMLKIFLRGNHFPSLIQNLLKKLSILVRLFLIILFIKNLF